MDSYITVPMRDAIGNVYDRQRSYPLSTSDIRRWAIAVYYPEAPPRIFWDEQYARETAHGGIVAPEEFNPFAWGTQVWTEESSASSSAEYDPGNIERTLGIEPPALNRFLHGGMEVEYVTRMRPGDVILSVTRLLGYSEHVGKKFGRMLFTTSELTWTIESGETVKRLRHTGIRYRGER